MLSNIFIAFRLRHDTYIYIYFAIVHEVHQKCHLVHKLKTQQHGVITKLDH